MYKNVCFYKCKITILECYNEQNYSLTFKKNIIFFGKK